MMRLASSTESIMMPAISDKKLTREEHLATNLSEKSVPGLVSPPFIQAEEDKLWSCGYCSLEFSDTTAISVHMDQQHSDIISITKHDILIKNVNGKRIQPFAALKTRRSVKQKTSEFESKTPAETIGEYYENISILAQDVFVSRCFSKTKDRDKHSSNNYQNYCEKRIVNTANIFNGNIKNSKENDKQMISSDYSGEDPDNINIDYNIIQEPENIESDKAQNKDEHQIVSLSDNCDKFFYKSMENGCEEISYCVNNQNDNEELIRALTESDEICENGVNENCIIEYSFLENIQNGHNSPDVIFGADELQESSMFDQGSPNLYTLPSNNCSQQPRICTAIEQEPEIPTLVRITTPQTHIVSNPFLLTTQILETHLSQTQMPQTQLEPPEIPQTEVTLPQTPDTQIKLNTLTQISQTHQTQMALSQILPTEMVLPQEHVKFTEMPHGQINIVRIPQIEVVPTQMTLSEIPQTQLTLKQMSETETPEPNLTLTQISHKLMPQTQMKLVQMAHAQMPPIDFSPKQILPQMPHTQIATTQMALVNLKLPPLVPVKQAKATLSKDNGHKDIPYNKAENNMVNVVSTLHNKENVKCPFCKDVFKSKSPLWIHLRIHQNERTCLTCGVTIETLKVTKPSHESGQPIKCLECDKAFQSPGHLQQHMVVHIGLPKSDKLRKSTHMRMYRRMRPLMCWDCSNGFRQLSAEAAMADWGRIVSCPQCSFVFPNSMKSFEVSQHIAKHLEILTDDQFDD